MKSTNKRKMAVSTKTSIISSVIVLILLCISSIISIKMQSVSSRQMIDNYTQSQSKELGEYTSLQNTLIRKKIMINLEICTNMAKIFLYNFDSSGLNNSLTNFVKTDEIIAIKALDVDGKPFAAVWKDTKIHKAVNIPAGIKLEKKFSFSKDATYESSKVGTVTIYYTNQLVKDEIVKKKTKAEKSIEGFTSIATKNINRSITSQFILSLCIIITLIVSIVLCLQFIVTKPINMITNNMNKGANQVEMASSQLSDASQSLAESSSQQAASIEETSSSMEEMSSMTRQNAENASQADNLMKEASIVVKNANDSMEQLIVSMDDISKASEETSKIIKTIDEIAFQTNLLALNAAVEAARAGEAGAGFAVVADEVRILAMRSADAAKVTANLIEGTVKKINLGTGLVSTTNDAFSQVKESTDKVGNLVTEIAEASREQSEGIEQVNKGITQMDEIVQHNAANAEESASASGEMNNQAKHLKNYISELTLLIKGSGKTRPMGPFANKVRSSQPKDRVPKKNTLTSSPKIISPNQVIPFDEDANDFRDF
jgi:methyl-accepting chemotaxis protein